MAIPKEPRQLMITIMYLVLTALLALNVSAEIFNAFKLVNKGLEKSNEVLDRQNSRIPDQVKQLALKDPEKYGDYAEKVDEIVATGEEFVSYVEGIWKELIDEAGGYKEGKKTIKNKKDKDVTTRLLVDKGKGEELKGKIQEARDKFLSLVDSADRSAFESKVALEIDDESWREAKKKESWADFNFRQMPIGAVQPILTKFINDAKATESAVLNHYLEKVGGTDVVFDKFEVVSAPEKSYIVKGDT
jgi:gliding motility-associated protein GldM